MKVKMKLGHQKNGFQEQSHYLYCRTTAHISLIHFFYFGLIYFLFSFANFVLPGNDG